MNSPPVAMISEIDGGGDDANDTESRMSALTYSIATNVSVSSTMIDEQQQQDDEDYQFERLSTKPALFAREKEISAMKACFQRVMDHNNHGAAELVLVQGESGSGKSAMVESLRAHVTSDACCGYFCAGKFDQGLMTGTTVEPFSAFAAAFSDIVDFILNDRQTLDARATSIRQALGPDAAILARFISNLTQLTGVPAAESYGNSPSTQHRILFRILLHALTSQEHPILLFLDDLQFADEESLDAFRSLATDQTLRHVLIVGAYRSTEMSRTELFGIEAPTTSAPLQTTELPVESLDLTATMEYLAYSLASDKDTVKPLAMALLSKSGGNPLYMTQFLNLLIERKFLKQDSVGQYSWNTQDIVARTDISENVLEVVAERVQSLPKHVRAVMIIIAHIGSSFDFQLLESVVLEFDHVGEAYPQVAIIMNLLRGDKSACLLNRTKYAVEIKAGLKRALMDGLIEQIGRDRYKFTHDRLHQYCYDMVSSEVGKVQLHYCIGQAAVTRVDDSDAALFFVVDQKNRSESFVTSAKDKVALTELNLKAGIAAAAQSAYQSASLYLQAGVKLTDDEAYWESNHSLMLDLYCTSADIEAKNSRFERSKELCEIVLSRAHNLDERLRVFVCLLEGLTAFESFAPASILARKFLRELGVKFPKNPNTLHVIISITQTKSLLGGVTDDKILSAPMMADKKKSTVLAILDALGLGSYITGHMELYVLVVLWMVRETIKFGLCSTSASTWANYAVINSSMGDRDGAWRFGNVANEILNRMPNDKEAAAKTLGKIHHFVLPWQRPFAESIEGFRRSADLSLQIGDTEFYYSAVSGVLTTMVHSGTNLHNTIETAHEMCRDMKDVSTFTRMSLVIQFAVENLAGASDYRVKLSSTTLSEDEIILHAQQNLLVLAVVNMYRLILAVTFNAWYLADEISFEAMKGLKLLDPHFISNLDRFYCALAYLESYRKQFGRRRQNLARVKQLVRKIEHVVKGGCTNYESHLLILKAGLKSIRCLNDQDTTEVQAMYRLAIEKCQSQQYLHLEAMANERASEVCFRVGDEEAASCFLWEARECYREWGADAKVEWIDEEVAKGRLPTPTRSTEHAT